MAALDAGANRVFQKNDVKSEEILTALKTALFPRVLSAQPRAKQAAAASPLDRSASMAPAPSAPTGEQPATPEAAVSSVAPARKISMGSGQSVAPAASNVTPVNKKILIIDADESVVSIYRAQIEAAGYEVEVALDGETGFHDIYAQNPDALLLDLLLPGGLSGSEILKKTRAQKKFEKMPVLVFTNIYTRDVEEEAKAAGVLLRCSTKRRPRPATWWLRSTKSSCPATCRARKLSRRRRSNSTCRRWRLSGSGSNVPTSDGRHADPGPARAGRRRFPGRNPRIAAPGRTGIRQGLARIAPGAPAQPGRCPSAIHPACWNCTRESTRLRATRPLPDSRRWRGFRVRWRRCCASSKRSPKGSIRRPSAPSRRRWTSWRCSSPTPASTRPANRFRSRSSSWTTRSSVAASSGIHWKKRV